MLTSNKAVYGTDGSLSYLGKLKPGSGDSDVSLHPASSGEKINILIGRADETDEMRIPYGEYVYVTLWIEYDEGGLKICHGIYEKSGRLQPVRLAAGDENAETYITPVSSDETDEDYAISFTTGSSYEIVYQEVLFFK